MNTLVLIRPTGEIAIKSRQTRGRFQRRLVECIEDALSTVTDDFEIRSQWGRIFVEADSRAVLGVLPRVYGITSLSEIEATAQPRLESIVEVGERTYADRVSGGTFAVRARRSGRHAFSSKDINYDLGTALNRYAQVDLSRPDVSVGVELREEGAYFYSETIPGPGGLPLGTEGKALALISGGYDSAVAAWRMLRRGVALDYLFCNLAGAAYERSVLAVGKLIADEWSYGTRPKIHVVDFERPVRHLKERVRESYWQVILKRLMYRAGERVAVETGRQAIVTGESVGQVSSQTLANLCAIEAAIEKPVLRPLVGFDKEEIIERSRAIGTYALSEKVQEHCALTEDRPVTATTAEEAAAEEAKLDTAVLEEAVTGRRTLDLRDLDASDLILPYLYATEIPNGTVVIDTRSRSQYEPWHYPGADHWDFWELMRDYKSLDRDKKYVLYCELGLKTAQLAEKMQQAGFEAYSYKGGVRALKESVTGNR